MPTSISIPPNTVSSSTPKHSRTQTVPVSPTAGDTWDELDTNNAHTMSWFWNGVYWLSTSLLALNSPLISTHSSTIAGTAVTIAPTSIISNFWLEYWGVSGRTDGATSQTNYWDFELRQVIPNNLVALLPGVQPLEISKNLLATESFRVASPKINLHLMAGEGNTFRAFSLNATKFNTAGNISQFSYWINYRYARK